MCLLGKGGMPCHFHLLSTTKNETLSTNTLKAECRYYLLFKCSVTIKIILLSVIRLSVILLCGAMLSFLYAKWHFAECHSAKKVINH
jgi:hypothetical protein